MCRICERPVPGAALEVHSEVCSMLAEAEAGAVSVAAQAVSTPA